jgi:hypothetical protein
MFFELRKFIGTQNWLTRSSLLMCLMMIRMLSLGLLLNVRLCELYMSGHPLARLPLFGLVKLQRKQNVRDQTVSRLLEQLCHESRTLLNTLKGSAVAIDNNQLWIIFNTLLPASHDQVSTSAVAKRTRELLSSVQSTSLPAFTESFTREAKQFTHDWESAIYPGYIKADSLLRNVFVEAIRGGADSVLLKPCLEHIALQAGDHRDASLITAQELLSSFYIRNKPSTSVEESVAFQGSGPPLQMPTKCSLCHSGSCVASDDLASIVSKFSAPGNRVSRYLNNAGQPRFCRSCLASPPPCACGSARTSAIHRVCNTCFRKKSKSSDSASSGKALIAPSASASASVPADPVPSPPPLTHPPMQHPPPHPYWSGPPPPVYGYHPPHSYHPHSQNRPPAGYFAGPYPGHVAPSAEDDALSDYGSSISGSHRGYACHVSSDDWQRFSGTDDFAYVTSLPPEDADAAPGLDSEVFPEYRSTYHADSAASMNCTDNLAHLHNPQPLTRVISITGIGGARVTFTHVGDLLWLPSGLRRCFYSPDFGARLISLAYLCRDKRTHFYNSPEHSALVILVDQKHFATCSQSINNLYPFPSVGRGTFHPPLTVDSFACASSLALRNFTPEQLARCDAVEGLLEAYCRPSDESLAHTIAYGGLGPHADGLTPSDVHLNRLLRGPDVYRAQSRVRDPPSRPSTSVPAPHPCHTLVLDPHHLKHPDIFGNTCKIHIVCEYTGAFFVVTSKSGTAATLLVALASFVRTVCNSKGHRVQFMHADAESVLVNLAAPLGDMGITLLLAPPQHHAKRVERYTQTFDERKRMLTAQLKYLPAPQLGLGIFLDMHVAASMRALVNTVSHPNTPEELITRQRASLHGLLVCPFLSLVTVRMGERKRAALAATMLIPLQQAPHAELAMCLGRAPAPHSASYYMYIPSTSKIVIRRYFKRLALGVLPPFCIPNTTFIAPVDPSANLRSAFPPGDSVQGHSLQHPERAAQAPSPTPAPLEVPLDLADGCDLPLAPDLSPVLGAPASQPPVAVRTSPLPSMSSPVLRATPPSPAPMTPVAPQSVAQPRRCPSPVRFHPLRVLFTPAHLRRLSWCGIYPQFFRLSPWYRSLLLPRTCSRSVLPVGQILASARLVLTTVPIFLSVSAGLLRWLLVLVSGMHFVLPPGLTFVQCRVLSLFLTHVGVALSQPP